MKCVHLWKCECGARLKVISETDARFSPGYQENVVCPGCKKRTPIDGRVNDVLVETEDKLWAGLHSGPSAA